MSDKQIDNLVIGFEKELKVVSKCKITNDLFDILLIYKNILKSDNELDIPKNIIFNDNIWSVYFFKGRNDFNWSDINTPDCDIKEEIYNLPGDDVPFIVLERYDELDGDLFMLLSTNLYRNVISIDRYNDPNIVINIDDIAEENRDRIINELGEV